MSCLRSVPLIEFSRLFPSCFKFFDSYSLRLYPPFPFSCPLDVGVKSNVRGHAFFPHGFLPPPPLINFYARPLRQHDLRALRFSNEYTVFRRISIGHSTFIGSFPAPSEVVYRSKFARLPLHSSLIAPAHVPPIRRESEPPAQIVSSLFF